MPVATLSCRSIVETSVLSPARHDIGAPFLGRVAVDGPPHLFGACRPNGAIGLVEFQYLRFELQSAIVEQPPHFGFRILDRSLVDDAVNAAGQNRVNVRHQANVVRIITADMIEVVSEGLPSCEVLTEVRKTAGQWMSSSVDNLRVRQDQLDERNVQPVVRQLVDEKGPIRPPLYSRATEVFLAKLEPLVGAQIQNTGRIFAILPA